MKYLISLVLGLMLFTSCEKPGLDICGTVTNGRVDMVNYMYYLEVDGKEYWVSQKTYESYYVGMYVCLEDY